MNNSRSQTKIRKTQQVNLLVEQRYLKQKGLLFNNLSYNIYNLFIIHIIIFLYIKINQLINKWSLIFMNY